MVEQKKIHYKHYLFCHPNVVYPYHMKAKFVCQFCGISKRVGTSTLLINKGDLAFNYTHNYFYRSTQLHSNTLTLD